MGTPQGAQFAQHTEIAPTIFPPVSASEARALDQVAERLAQRFPDVPRAGVIETVGAIHQQFNASRIRDYIPIFVEREARQQLAHPELGLRKEAPITARRCLWAQLRVRGERWFSVDFSDKARRRHWRLVVRDNPHVPDWGLTRGTDTDEFAAPLRTRPVRSRGWGGHWPLAQRHACQPVRRAPVRILLGDQRHGPWVAPPHLK